MRQVNMLSPLPLNVICTAEKMVTIENQLARKVIAHFVSQEIKIGKKKIRNSRIFHLK